MPPSAPSPSPTTHLPQRANASAGARSPRTEDEGINAFMDPGSVAAVLHFPSPMRSAAPRLAWAAVASIIVHAALLYVPSWTSPSVGHPVMTLIVRTIATTSDVAVPASSAH